MKKVIVTGAKGFIGRHALSALQKRDFQVHAISRAAPQQDPSGILWHQLDLMNAASVVSFCKSIEATHLLHLAWYTKHSQFWHAEENLHWVEASLNLLRAFSKAGGRRSVISGTCAEYDWTRGHCVENKTQYTPQTLYGASKYAVHIISDNYYRNKNISSAWGHIFFLFGPYEFPQRFVPQLINGLLDAKQVSCSAGTQIRDFMHVYDVADALVSLLDSEVEGAVNIASGQPLTLHLFAEKIFELIDSHGSISFGTQQIPAHEPAKITADTTRLYREVGWQPNLSIDAAIKMTIDWWQQYREIVK